MKKHLKWYLIIFCSVFRKKQNNATYWLFHQSSVVLPGMDNGCTIQTRTLFLTSGTPSVCRYISTPHFGGVFSLLNEEHKFTVFVCTKQQMFTSSLSSNSYATMLLFIKRIFFYFIVLSHGFIQDGLVAVYQLSTLCNFWTMLIVVSIPSPIHCKLLFYF